MKIVKIIILTLIIGLAAFLRLYKLTQVPPSINWDEAAAGYNAYTIANWGADEYGNKWPIVFKSFADDKHPVHIYITALMVKVFGLSDFTIRFGSALLGVLSVVAIYFLAKRLFKSELAGIFSSLLLAVSPYAMQYSRGLWEANFALSFFIIGMAIFFRGVEKRNWLLPLSVLLFGLSFLSYHSALVVVPPVVLLLLILNIKKIFTNKKILIVSAVIALLFGLLVLKDTRILGFARINQTQFSEDVIKKYGGILPTYIHNYKNYFTYQYLFKSGDINPRASVGVTGEFYKIDLVLFAIAILGCVFRKKWQSLGIITLWLLLTPIPGALSSTDANATRGIFMIGPVILMSGFGASVVAEIIKKSWLKILVGVGIVTALGFEVVPYINYYYTTYPKKDAIEWQYGMKQIVDYLKVNPNYAQVYMDKIRQQPYIFYLYYLKTPLPELLETVRYDRSESKSYNTVVSFDKYQFGGAWDIIHSYPNRGVIYIMTPSYYTGLFYRDQFEIKKLIKYPNGNDAFYIVEGYQ